MTTLLAVFLLFTSAGNTPLTAALDAYFELMHGGTGIAMPENRRPVLLHRRTIVPTREQLPVRVSSPANEDGARRYNAVIGAVTERFLQPARETLSSAPPHYRFDDAKRTSCGPQFDSAMFTDAVAVSRPVILSPGEALVYLEHSGGARAFHAIRRGGRWVIDWSVELWACG